MNGKKADFVLKNGIIYSVDEADRMYEALAVKDGRIMFLGTNGETEEYISEKTVCIDLKGKMVLPGFIDAHTHPSANVDSLFSIDLNGLTSEEAYISAVREAIADGENKRLLYGYGWLPPFFENGIPRKEALDAVSTEIPIVLWDQGYHNMWVNSKALVQAGISADTYPDEEGIVRDEARTPVGMLKEKATCLMSDSLCDYGIEQYKETLRLFEEQMLAKGITSVLDACIYPRNGKPGYPGLNAYRGLLEMDRQQRLKMKYASAVVVEPDMELNEENVALIDSMRREADGEHFHIDTIKMYIDGTIEGETAYLYEDYADNPGYRGESNWDDETLYRYSDFFNRKGYNLHYHAIGDAAVGQALDAIAYAQAHSGAKNRYGIAHIQLLSDADLERLYALDVAAVVQPFWFHPDDYYDMMKWMLGEKRADHQYPLASYFKKGVLAASSSDFPVTPDPAPLKAIACGCTRQNWTEDQAEDGVQKNILPQESECADVRQMIRTVTVYGAKSMGMEQTIGSLEVGKAADMVVLERNILEIPPQAIGSVRILYTFADGKIVYRRGDDNK